MNALEQALTDAKALKLEGPALLACAADNVRHLWGQLLDQAGTTNPEVLEKSLVAAGFLSIDRSALAHQPFTAARRIAARALGLQA